jgi:predicted tellurium resistance membrane protein TerC
MIGLTLIAEGLQQHISKGYVYFAMGFSVFVEIINLRMRAVRIKPVNLRSPYRGEEAFLPLQPVAVKSKVKAKKKSAK